LFYQRFKRSSFNALKDIGVRRQKIGYQMVTLARKYSAGLLGHVHADAALQVAFQRHDGAAQDLLPVVDLMNHHFGRKVSDEKTFYFYYEYSSWI
jgi:hypothetical protein